MDKNQISKIESGRTPLKRLGLSRSKVHITNSISSQIAKASLEKQAVIKNDENIETKNSSQCSTDIENSINESSDASIDKNKTNQTPKTIQADTNQVFIPMSFNSNDSVNVNQLETDPIKQSSSKQQKNRLSLTLTPKKITNTQKRKLNMNTKDSPKQQKLNLNPTNTNDEIEIIDLDNYKVESKKKKVNAQNIEIQKWSDNLQTCDSKTKESAESNQNINALDSYFPTETKGGVLQKIFEETLNAQVKEKQILLEIQTANDKIKDLIKKWTEAGIEVTNEISQIKGTNVEQVLKAFNIPNSFFGYDPITQEFYPTYP